MSLRQKKEVVAIFFLKCLFAALLVIFFVMNRRFCIVPKKVFKLPQHASLDALATL